MVNVGQTVQAGANAVRGDHEREIGYEKTVIASAAKQSRASANRPLDCFVGFASSQ